MFGRTSSGSRFFLTYKRSPTESTICISTCKRPTSGIPARSATYVHRKTAQWDLRRSSELRKTCAICTVGISPAIRFCTFSYRTDPHGEEHRYLHIRTANLKHPSQKPPVYSNPQMPLLLILYGVRALHFRPNSSKNVNQSPPVVDRPANSLG